MHIYMISGRVNVVDATCKETADYGAAKMFTYCFPLIDVPGNKGYSVYRFTLGVYSC